jgi:transposase
MRVAQPIVLEADVRRKLEQQSRGRSTAARVVLRSRIVLLAADGLQNKQIAATLHVAPRMVTLWRGRFLKQGVAGLLKDAPRPGRTPSITTEVTATLIAKTTQSTPANATHWSTRTMAREMGVSKASVSRIWRANGLKPHRVESFKVSNDPLFADKLEAIVGLYLNPPEHALVLSVDENYSTHKHERVQRWLEKHKRFHVRFTPTSASWLNMVERFFRDITHNRIRRGVFQDLEQLIMAIGNYIDVHNQNPKPFIWTAKANDILEKVTRAKAVLNNRRSA